MPCPATVCHRLLVFPNRKDDDTTWSPAFSSACEQRADRRHAGAEAQGGHAVFHLA
jgi:hypothetical protein